MERRRFQQEHRDATAKAHALGDEDRAHIREAEEWQRAAPYGALRRPQKPLEATALGRTRKRLRVGSLWQDNGPVFPTTTGTTMSCTNLLGRHFKPLLKRAGLPNIRLHDLRHTCATMLLKMGQHPKYVQELLDHASISITLDTYSHVIEGMGEGLADAMDSFL
jgi:integrase